jgi:hypothetical protein
MEPQKQKWLQRLYYYFKKHWLFSTILNIILIIWFPLIFTYLGNHWLVTIDPNGVKNLTTIGLVFTLVILIPIILLRTSNDFHASREKDMLEDDYIRVQKFSYVLRHTLSGHEEINRDKQRRFVDFIKALKHNKSDTTNTFSTITQPEAQIVRTVSEIAGCLAELSVEDKDKVVVSLAYRVDNQGDYQWLDDTYLSSGLSLEELSSNKKSTFYQLILENRTICYNNKDTAYKAGHYVPDARDDENSNCGSIICKRIRLSREADVFIDSILSISTYGFMFANDDSKATIKAVYENIQLILHHFESSIVCEMALLYMKRKGCT